MKLVIFFLMLSCVVIPCVKGQSVNDTTLLNEVIIQAYDYGKPLNEVPAAVGLILSDELKRYDHTSMLPAANAVAGVRMEERSPGSFRFSIRGSLLRSPFGVRNIKVYWNGLPFTDGGGNTYLNVIDFKAIQSAEIIKGPGGSLYGAGTGGVVMLNPAESTGSRVYLSALLGSYGLQRHEVSGQWSGNKVNGTVLYANQQSSGYRAQSGNNRNSIHTHWNVALPKTATLSLDAFYTDLHYETPGGLTRSQFEEDPAQARQPTATVPGAEAQHAAVNNATLYGGVKLAQELNDKWSYKAGVCVAFTDFANPAILNYEKRKEHNLGGRVDVMYAFRLKEMEGKFTWGGEYQHFFSPVKVYENNQGIRGALQYANDLKSRHLLAFAQAELNLPAGFHATVGASGTSLQYGFDSQDNPSEQGRKTFHTVLSPRIALLKKFSEKISWYGSVSKGFSPPSLAEVRPSTNIINHKLQAEQGVSVETGTHMQITSRFNATITCYDFKLRDAIVMLTDDLGRDYFVNAGSTIQRGIEFSGAWMPLKDRYKHGDLKVWSSYTFNTYTFDKYTHDGVDYSGKSITGVAPNIFVSGIDFSLKKGFYVNIIFTYTDKMPLNDANSEFASSYKLINVKAGYSFSSKRSALEIFIGANNLLNEKYSLGNDLNAAGGRYFNAAAPVNFYAGLSLSTQAKRKDQ